MPSKTVVPSNDPDATPAARAAWFDAKADRLESQAAEARAAAAAARTSGGPGRGAVASAGVAAAAAATEPPDPTNGDDA